MIITEYNPEKILSATVLNFAQYVINPYRGCEFGCIYCYAKSFKSIKKRLNKIEYGNFVDVKINAIELLEKELNIYKPEKVILGASTEIYQPVEKKYRLTRQILEILNAKNIKIYLLTKSDMITRDIDIINSDNTLIFYTINSTDDKISSIFENNTPSYIKRFNTLKMLKEANINVVLHIGPVLPEITDYEKIVSDTFDYVKSFEFENLNLNSVKKTLFLEKIKDNYPALFQYYSYLFEDLVSYNKYWEILQKKLKNLFENKNKKYYTFYHDVKNYFNNELIRK